jgi:hypothetical protein
MRGLNRDNPARTDVLRPKSIFVFGCTMATLVACGGSIVQEVTGDAEGDVGHGLDSSDQEHACSLSSGCLVGPLPASEDGYSGMSRDAGEGTKEGVLCGYQTGPIAPGQDASGRIVQCPVTWLCVNVDKGWACCTVEGTGGVSFCQP